MCSKNHHGHASNSWAALIENVIIIIKQVYKGRGEKESRLRATGLPKK